MLIKDKYQLTLGEFLDKATLFGIFIFALSSLISKGISSVGLGLACLFWIIRIIVTENYNFNKTELDKAILFFIAALLFSGVDVYSLQVLDEIDNILLAILFYYVIVNTIKNLNLVKKLSYFALVSMLISLIYGFHQKFNLRMDRINGFSFPLSYGNLLSIFLLFVISYVLWCNMNFKKRLSLLVIFIMLKINFLFTLARGAWLGFIGGIFSIILIKDKKLIGVLLICFILLIFFLPQTIINRFKSIVDLENDKSIITRINLWKGSWRMFADHPINGVGIGYFTKEFNRNYRLDSQIIVNASHAHNNFLHFLATTGLIGFLTFLFLTAKIIYVMHKGYKSLNLKQWELFILSSLGSIISFSLHGVTEYSFGDTETVRFFWFLIALSMIVINKK